MLIARVWLAADIALGQQVRHEIDQVPLERRVVVIAAHALNEGALRDQVARVDAELQIVPAARPTDVIHELVCVLDGGLRSAGERPDLHAQIVLDLDVRKYVQTGVLEVRNRTAVGK